MHPLYSNFRAMIAWRGERAGIDKYVIVIREGAKCQTPLFVSRLVVKTSLYIFILFNSRNVAKSASLDVDINTNNLIWTIQQPIGKSTEFYFNIVNITRRRWLSLFSTSLPLFISMTAGSFGIWEKHYIKVQQDQLEMQMGFLCCYSQLCLG